MGSHSPTDYLRPRHLYERFRALARQDPDAQILTDCGVSTTRDELLEMAHRLGLDDVVGRADGTRVVCHVPTGEAERLACVLGAWRCDAAPLAGSSVFSDLGQLSMAVCGDLRDAREVVVDGNQRLVVVSVDLGVIPGLLSVTSGSTGEPKVVVHAADSVMAAATNTIHREGVLRDVGGQTPRGVAAELLARRVADPGARLRLATTVPTTFTAGFSLARQALLFGDHLIVVDPRRSILRAVHEERAHVLSVAPHQAAELMHSGAGLPSSLLSVGLGGATVSPRVVTGLLQRGIPMVVCGYGATEVGGAVGVSAVSGAGSDLPEYAPVGDVQVRIDATTNYDGALWVSSAALAEGYVASGRLVDDAFVRTAEGRWWNSGDRGRWVGAGFAVTGRQDPDVRSRGGRLLSLESVRAALSEMPGVLEVRTSVRVGGHDASDLVVSVVVADPEVGRREIRRWLGGKLGRHAVPQRVEIVTADCET